MCTRPMNIDLDGGAKKRELSRYVSQYVSHTPPDSLMSAMTEMQKYGSSPQQTVQNVYQCMKSSIENKISIYGIQHDTSSRPKWTNTLRNRLTEYVIDHNVSVHISMEKKNSIYLYELHGNNITIESDIAHLMLIDCNDIKLTYVHPPVSGISIMRCVNISISEDGLNTSCTNMNVDNANIDNMDICDVGIKDIMSDTRLRTGLGGLGYLDCEYSSDINIESALESGFTLYCVGSVNIGINHEQLECGIYDQILGRTDDMDISFLLGQSGTGMVYNR